MRPNHDVFSGLIDNLLTPGGDVYSNGRASARVTAQFRRQRVDQATNVKHQKRLRAERLVADAARLVQRLFHFFFW